MGLTVVKNHNTAGEALNRHSVHSTHYHYSFVNNVLLSEANNSVLPDLNLKSCSFQVLTAM